MPYAMTGHRLRLQRSDVNRMSDLALNVGRPCLIMLNSSYALGLIQFRGQTADEDARLSSPKLEDVLDWQFQENSRYEIEEAVIGCRADRIIESLSPA